jgi:hypothetical protein
MSKAKWAEDTLKIRGKDIPVKIGELPVMELNFFVENPRIYSAMWASGEVPDQDEIYENLRKFDNVKELMQDIKLNGGLMEPVIVKDGSFEVLEGNRRLAAYRMLYEKDAISWGRIKATLLPKDVLEEDVFALLGQYHIKGRADWAPYEQAGFLYRRFKNHKITKAQLAKEIGLSAMRVGDLINTYEFMLNHNIKDINKWSHCEVYRKSPGIRKVAVKMPEIETRFISDLKKGKIKQAVDIRDKLGKIDKASAKVQKAYVEGEISIEEAFERAVDGGGTNEIYNKLHKFRQWFVEPSVASDVGSADVSAFKKIKYELNKIDQRISQLKNKMDNLN